MESLVSLGNELYSAKTSISFVGKRRIWYLIVVAIISGSAAFLGIAELAPGINFKGGSEITITGLSSLSEHPTNEVLSKNDLAAGSSMMAMGSSSVRVQTSELSKQRLDSLAGRFATAHRTDASNISAMTVGSTWFSDITKKTIRGLILFFVFVELLVWAYFRTWKMAAAVLFAPYHGIIITVGIYTLPGFEVTPTATTGVLTTLGCSLYDTVVVFDKIRGNTEGFESQGRSIYAKLANLAASQIFIHSINTSVVGVLPVASLLFVGAFILEAEALCDIALTLFIGMIAGALSSTFLVTPLLMGLRSRETRIKEQVTKAAVAHQHRRGEAGDDVGELAKIDAAPAAPPVTPGHRLGVAIQSKRKKKCR